MLIIISFASIFNIIRKQKKHRIFHFLFLPFFIYYISIIYISILDINNDIFDSEFILRNISILIIPLFIFTSNFSKNQIVDVLKKTSVLITIVGLYFLMLWVYGYYSYNKQNEFQKIDWYKSEIITPINYISKASNFNIKINSNAIKPSLRKVVMLSNSQAESYAVRELILKVKNNIKKDVWVLLRNVNSGDCKVWFNVSTGKIGKIEGETTEVNSEKVFNNFYKFTFLNKIKKNNNREWFYLSFVSSNGSYSWSKQYQQDVIVELQNPSFYLDSGQNLLIDESFFEHKLTDFSYLKNYSHSTYFGLIFIFSLIIFIFNSFSNKYLKISAILLNGFFIITLASKAIIISLFLIIPIYYLYHYFNYKYLFIFILVGLFLSFNSHVKERFSDMYTTIINIKKNENLGDLKTLSTNNRIHIYKNYISLIKENYLIGYGYKKGAKIVESKYNYTFNTHNQYLQSIFYGGFFGFLSLILFSFSPFFLKVKKVGLDILIIIILFNFLFESMLVRQWGLVFVCFCYAIYFQFLKPDLKWFQ